MRYFVPRTVSLAAVCLLTIVGTVRSQTPTRLGFYNVQNLFDTINDPSVNDAQFSDRTTNLYDRKLSEIAHAIALFDPDILGVCEVENYGVLDQLSRRTNRLNTIVHFDSRDSRGIDVALIFDSAKYSLVSGQLAGLKFVTRDLLRVELIARIDDRPLVIYVAHLPSKLGGRGAAARRERALAAMDSLAYIETIESVIFCGDMNDNPTAKRYLYNCAVNPYLEGMGSYVYRDVWSMLDQIIVSPAVSRTMSTDQMVVDNSILITQAGRYEGYPKRNRPSDHLPVYIDFVL